MRDRHEHQVEDLRATLEASLNAPDARPSRWTPQLVDMRRQQKRLVRERKFGEALDLLKAAETREAEEIEWHRQTMRCEHVKALESLFEQADDFLEEVGEIQTIIAQLGMPPLQPDCSNTLEETGWFHSHKPSPGQTLARPPRIAHLMPSLITCP